MFDAVARRYDLANDVLSLGQDRRWRRAVTAGVAPRPGERVLDLAAGTATSSTALAATGAHVVGCDFSLGMLRVGARRLGGAAHHGVTLAAGDALRLPFAAKTFDAVTISFGPRRPAGGRPPAACRGRSRSRPRARRWPPTPSRTSPCRPRGRAPAHPAGGPPRR